MSKARSDRVPIELRITEESVPLQFWGASDGQDRLGVIEEDIRRLMHELADVKFSDSQLERSHAEEMRQLLLSIVQIADSFDGVFQNIERRQDQLTPQMKMWLSNFRTVRRSLLSLLSARGVTKIENLDQGFDARWHQVVETVPDLTSADGTIVEEVRGGYLWRNQLLRKAEVVVVSSAGGVGPT